MKVIIPTALRKHTAGQHHLSVNATTVDQAIEQVISVYPELKNSLFDDAGDFASFINLFVNDRNIRDLNHGSTELSESDELLIVPAIAGG